MRLCSKNRANPNGRPRKHHSLGADIARELSAKVTITENGKRKRVSKASASAKQIANNGAAGDLRAAKIVMDLARKADADREAAPERAALTDSDMAIAMRFIERLKATELSEESSDDAQPSGV
jgi:hypothetical protein